MDLSIIVPAYNEARRLPSTLEKLIEFCERECSRWEIIVVDDGSRDGTPRTLKAFAGSARLRYLRNEVNRGKGYSIRRGVLEACRDLVLFTDADLSAPIAESLTLFRALERGAEIAIGSRRPHAGKAVERSLPRKLMAAAFRGLVKTIVLRGFHDTQCGFKMFRREAARTIFAVQRIDGWAFDVEVLFLARRFGFRVVEVPIEWHGAGESRLRLLSPLKMVFELLKIRWNQWSGKYRGGSREAPSSGSHAETRREARKGGRRDP
jgi:dolichyl-phosphate beta-glucosyltransferase